MCEEIKRRFDQKDLKVVADMESLLLDSANGLIRVVPESIVSMYCSRDLDKEHLAIHLRMLPNVIEQYNFNSGCVIKKVTSIRTLCDVLNFSGGGNQLLSQVHTLLQLFLTIPVTVQ